MITPHDDSNPPAYRLHWLANVDPLHPWHDLQDIHRSIATQVEQLTRERDDALRRLAARSDPRVPEHLLARMEDRRERLRLAEAAYDPLARVLRRRPAFTPPEDSSPPPVSPLSAPDCPFCRVIAGDDERTSLKLDGPEVVAFVPLNPVTPGHLLFVPRAHTEWHTASAPDATAATVSRAAWFAVSQAEYPQFNLITSCGPSATQTIEHIHVHLVPRRPADGLHLPWRAQ